MNTNYRQAANSLHQYLYNNHWDGERLIGPDCGVRWNRKVLRYGKSLLSTVDWKDDYYYLQAQAYWIMANLSFAEVSTDSDYRAIAQACANTIVETQKPEGYWQYPNPEWAGRIHTVDCTWAAIGLVATYESDTTQEQVINAAKDWYNYLVKVTQFQEYENTLAVNYFANRKTAIIPNNTPVVLAFLGRLAAATNDDSYLELAAKLVAFMALVQRDDGEIPYRIPNAQGEGDEKVHFQCHQYNAFQLQHLAMYHAYTGDDNVLPVIERIAKFIASSVRADGSTKFDCQNTPHYVYYHTMVVSSSLGIARRLGLCDEQALEDRALAYVLAHQRPDGSFPYSTDYFFVPDKRAYPRTLSMTLYHLLNRRLDTKNTQEKVNAAP